MVMILMESRNNVRLSLKFVRFLSEKNSVSRVIHSQQKIVAKRFTKYQEIFVIIFIFTGFLFRKQVDCTKEAYMGET
jgi:hypothetical protein